MSPMNVFIKFFLETESPDLVLELPKKMVSALDIVELPAAHYDFNKDSYVLSKEAGEVSEHDFKEYIDRYNNATHGEIVSHLRSDLSEEIKKYFSSREVVHVIECRLFDHYLKTGTAAFDE